MRGDPHRRRQANDQGFTVQIAGGKRDSATHQQHHQHRIARHHALAHQVGDEHRQHQQRLALQGHEQAGAEAEQNPRQHRRRNGAGQFADDPVKGPANAHCKNNQATDQVGAHGLFHGNPRQQRHQQRRTRRRPGNNHRHPVAQAQADAQHGAADGNRPNPGRQQLPGHLRAFGSLENNHQGPGIGNHRGDKPGHCRRQGKVMEKRFHGTSPQDSSGNPWHRAWVLLFYRTWATRHCAVSHRLRRGWASGPQWRGWNVGC